MEYEKQETIASNYVFDFDKLDMLIQANQYEKDQGLDLQEFFDTTVHRFKTPYGLSVTIRLYHSLANQNTNRKAKRATSQKFICLLTNTPIKRLM